MEYHSQGWRMSLEFSLLQKCKCEVLYFILEIVMGTWWDTRKTCGFLNGKMKICLAFMLAFHYWTSEEFLTTFEEWSHDYFRLIPPEYSPCTPKHQAAAEITESFLCINNARSGSKVMFGQSRCETLFFCKAFCLGFNPMSEFSSSLMLIIYERCIRIHLHCWALPRDFNRHFYVQGSFWRIYVFLCSVLTLVCLPGSYENYLPNSSRLWLGNRQ